MINASPDGFLEGMSTTLDYKDSDGLPDVAVDVIYQTREVMFHRDIQTPRREMKIRRAVEYF